MRDDSISICSYCRHLLFKEYNIHYKILNTDGSNNVSLKILKAILFEIDEASECQLCDACYRLLTLNIADKLDWVRPTRLDCLKNKWSV